VTSIYVGNLAYEATEQELREAFEQYGEVSSVTEPLNNSTWTKKKYFRRFFRKPHILRCCQC